METAVQSPMTCPSYRRLDAGEVENSRRRLGVLPGSMPLGDLPLRRFPAHPAALRRLRYPRPPRFAFASPNLMADDAKDAIGHRRMESTTQQIAEKSEVRSENVASPPEKPLPGDCCGSGCARCVWDVYYEQLEDYNNRRDKNTKP